MREDKKWNNEQRKQIYRGVEEGEVESLKSNDPVT